MRATKPSVRYYARFRGAQGFLRAVIRYESARKYITTDIPITSSQLTRLDTSGRMERVCTSADKVLSAQLQAFNTAVWSVVAPLLDNGTFAETSSDILDREVRQTYNGRKGEVL